MPSLPVGEQRTRATIPTTTSSSHRSKSSPAPHPSDAYAHCFVQTDVAYHYNYYEPTSVKRIVTDPKI